MRVPVDGLRRAEVLVLAPGLPDVATLFTFVRDAELRFLTLRMRVEETNVGIGGDRRTVHEVSVRHPGHAKVVSTNEVKDAAGAEAPAQKSRAGRSLSSAAKAAADVKGQPKVAAASKRKS